MEARRPDIAERIADLALSGDSYPRLVENLRLYARGLLDGGYPREALLADFERARGVLRARGSQEDADDSILDVMDFLTGFCSRAARL